MQSAMHTDRRLLIGAGPPLAGVGQNQVDVLSVGSRRRLAARQLQTTSAANVDVTLPHSPRRTFACPVSRLPMLLPPPQFTVSFPAATLAAAEAAAGSVDVSATLEAADPIAVFVGGRMITVDPAAATVGERHYQFDDVETSREPLLTISLVSRFQNQSRPRLSTTLPRGRPPRQPLESPPPPQPQHPPPPPPPRPRPPLPPWRRRSLRPHRR